MTDPNPRRSSRRLIVVIAALLLTAAAVAYLALRPPAPADARSFIPADVRTAVVVPSLSALHVGVSDLLVQVEGASGAIALASAQVGVDLSSLEALENKGVATEGSLVAYLRGDATVLQVSINSRSDFLALIREHAAPGLGASLVPELVPSGMDLEMAELPMGLGLLWGSMHSGLGTVMIIPSLASAQESWSELAQAPVAPLAPPAASGLVWAMGDFTPALPAGLGPARVVLSSYVSPLSRWTGSLTADADGLRVTVDGDWQGSGTPPLSFFNAPSQGKAIRAYVPQATTALVTGRWRPEAISSMPAWIRSAALPERLPGLAGASLPPTRELLELLHGDVGFAVFGLSKAGSVDLTRMPGSVTEIMTRLLGVGFFIRASQGDRVAGVLASVAEALVARGWQVTPIKKGPWIGFDLYTTRPQQRWALVARDDVAALVTASELPGLVEVAKGSALAHGSPAPTEGSEPTVALHLSFERIARELASRGVPPYFLTMLSGIERAHLEASLHDKGLKVAVEVGL